jgi:imidazolonepropionase-like amidohydrolase
MTRVALHVSLGEGGAGAAGGARSLSLSRLREALDDARLYAQRRAAFDRRQMRESRVSRLDLERLSEALAGRLPVVVAVSRASDILRVLELAKAYGLRLVLQGAEEAWVVADAIAAARVPVIVQPFDNLPRGFERLGTRHDNAALLAAAGVDVIITTYGPHRAHTLRQEAGNAVARGLAWEQALSAVTLAPARALGIERDHGTVAAGRVANLVVWDGDPFELSTSAVHVLVRGREQSLRTRQDALVERYRVLP